ncbi:MAG: sugar porter family MFS transporter, partial [Gammaproteobacteria bacterium]|nr:sugar porter family MFS transporter [Gammaproteobacteria bacterium]
DRFGRRTMILTVSPIFLIGIILLFISNTFFTLLFARVIIGIGAGITAIAIPSYLSEISPATIRGRSIATFQLFLTLGILSSYIIDTIFTPSGNWRAMFAITIIPALFLFVTMYFLPESPRWLFSKGKQQQAKNILNRTRLPKEAEKEAKEIMASLNVNQAKWSDVFSKSLMWPLLLSIFIGVFNQLTAVNGFLQYAPSIFRDAGFSSRVSDMQCAIALGAINVVGTILGMLVVDKIGRRTLLKLGIGGIVLTYLYLSVGYMLSLPSVAALIGLIIFIFCFACGPGVVAWIIVSELFPTKVRSKGLAIVLFFTSLSGWMVTSLFLQIEKQLHLGGAYYLFGTFSILYFIVIAKFLPETKQKSLEQIQQEGLS